MHAGLAVARAAQRTPHALALFDGHRRLTYAQLDERSNRLARVLREHFGLTKGDRVVLLMRNRVEVVAVLAAAAKAGVVYVGLNYRTSIDDLRGVFENCHPRLVITEAGFAAAAESLAERESIPIVDVDAPEYRSLLANCLASMPSSAHDLTPTDDGYIVYSSGTTGLPKGILFDHAAALQHATIACIEYDITMDTRYLIEIAHSSSVNITILPCLSVGAAIGFDDTPNFDPDRFADAVQQAAASHTFLVPTQLVRLLDQLPSVEPRLDSLRTLGYGASPISPSRLAELVERFGPYLIQLYGMAEIASIGTLLRKEDHVRARSKPELLASCGRPSIGVDVRIVDDNRRSVGPGERGEVIFSGAHVMKGYYHDPTRTHEVLNDGWMHSGDIATSDEDGYLYIVDRKKHMIIRGGLNIAPTEIENVLYQHPAVLDAAAVGAPDPEWGERIIGLVTLADGASASAEELLSWCRKSGLASIKQPELIQIIDDMPKNGVGKIDKAMIRSSFWTSGRQV